MLPEYCVPAGIRLEKENEEIEIEDRILRDIKNVFRLEKENEVIKDIILRDIRNLFEDEEEGNYFKQVRVCIFFFSNNYIEYESNDDKNKTLLVEEYLKKIRPYLKDILNDLKKSDRWNIQLTIAINFIFLKTTMTNK